MINMTSQELENFKKSWEEQQKFIDEREKEFIRNAQRLWREIQQED